MKLHRVDIICGNSSRAMGARMPMSKGPIENQIREIISLESRLRVGAWSSGYIATRTYPVSMNIGYMLWSRIWGWKQSDEA